MKSKFTRGLVAIATSVVVTAAGVSAAPVALADSSDSGYAAQDGSTRAGYGVLYFASSVVGLAITVAFWGTVYNTLINHGTIQGTKIAQLPSF